MRAPLRVALGGGGTDLPSYYREHGGLVVSTAIDKYVHMTRLLALPAPLRAQAPGVGGGRPPERGPPPDPARRARAPLGRAGRSSSPPSATRRPEPAWARPAPTRSARSRHWPGCPGASSSQRGSRRPPATSRSTCSAARSASRTSTRPRMAGCAPTTSNRDDRVDVRELRLSEACAPRCATSSCSSSPGPGALGLRHPRGRARPRSALHRPSELAGETCRGARGGRSRPARRADGRALGGQAPRAPPGR